MCFCCFLFLRGGLKKTAVADFLTQKKSLVNQSLITHSVSKWDMCGIMIDWLQTLPNFIPTRSGKHRITTLTTIISIIGDSWTTKLTCGWWTSGVRWRALRQTGTDVSCRGRTRASGPQKSKSPKCIFAFFTTIFYYWPVNVWSSMQNNWQNCPCFLCFGQRWSWFSELLPTAMMLMNESPCALIPHRHSPPHRRQSLEPSSIWCDRCCWTWTRPRVEIPCSSSGWHCPTGRYSWQTCSGTWGQRSA